MKLPIIKKLKTRSYRELAAFQDAAIDILYDIESSVVIHGGTAVWRCFGGNRFSNDIDVYLGSAGHIADMKEKINRAAPDYNVKLEKIKDTGNLIFMAFSSGDSYLKVEINHRPRGLSPVAKRYERVDGTYRDVLTLEPEALILEKIGAYSDRKFIRDIYDMYVLSDYVAPTDRVRKTVLNFTANVPEPANEEDLKTLIYDGPVPSFKSMIGHIKARFA